MPVKLAECDECGAIVRDSIVQKRTHEQWHRDTEGRSDIDRVWFSVIGSVVVTP